jgi:hypothetical protein
MLQLISSNLNADDASPTPSSAFNDTPKNDMAFAPALPSLNARINAD